MAISVEWLGVAMERRADLRAALLRAELSLEELDQREQAGPTLFVVDRAPPDLAERVQRASRGGQERALVAACSRAELADGLSWRLRRAGASDVMVWDRARDPAAEIAARFTRWAEVDRIVGSSMVQDNLVGASRAWRSLLREIVEVAVFTDLSVLILGESGTGKELIARLIHSLDQRRGRADLVVLDCTTIVPELSGSEFFGHERGAFTGAVGPRDGAFALADGGTLFLDEVGELPARLQAQILRVIQERTYKRVGGNQWSSTCFRLVCATNRDLPGDVARGEFRRDLYHRIASWVCHVPPLRERPEDILPLVRRFLQQLRPDDSLELDDTVAEWLVQRSYPGNVRDLRQLVQRICQRHVGGGAITVGDVPEDELPAADPSLAAGFVGFDDCIARALACGVGLKEIGRLAHETAVRLAIADADGNLQRAARRLGVTDRALQMRRRAEPRVAVER